MESVAHGPILRRDTRTIRLAAVQVFVQAGFQVVFFDRTVVGTGLEEVILLSRWTAFDGPAGLDAFSLGLHEEVVWRRQVGGWAGELSGVGRGLDDGDGEGSACTQCACDVLRGCRDVADGERSSHRLWSLNVGLSGIDTTAGKHIVFGAVLVVAIIQVFGVARFHFI